MSIRHYNPRRRKIDGISPRASAFFLTVFAIALLLQITYPLVSGETLRLVTISAIYWAAGAMCLHALFSYGLRYAAIYIGLTLLFAFSIKEIGVQTGWPFGQYSYDVSLGPQIFNVPLVVPFLWLGMAHPILIVARRVGKNWVFLYGGLTLMAWDLFLDPEMVAAGRWSWTFTGAHLPYAANIPLSNAFGWLLAGMGLMALLNVALPKERRKVGTSLVAVDLFLAWSWFSGVIGNLFFFDRPGVALLAGLIYGALLVPYALSRWLGRP